MESAKEQATASENLIEPRAWSGSRRGGQGRSGGHALASICTFTSAASCNRHPSRYHHWFPNRHPLLQWFSTCGA